MRSPISAIATVEIETRKDSIKKLQGERRRPRPEPPPPIPEVLPLVSPCPKAPYAMGLRPSMLTYGPVRAGRLLPKENVLFTYWQGTWQLPSLVPALKGRRRARGLGRHGRAWTQSLPACRTGAARAHPYQLMADEEKKQTDEGRATEKTPKRKPLKRKVALIFQQTRLNANSSPARRCNTSSSSHLVQRTS